MPQLALQAKMAAMAESNRKRNMVLESSRVAVQGLLQAYGMAEEAKRQAAMRDMEQQRINLLEKRQGKEIEVMGANIGLLKEEVKAARAQTERILMMSPAELAALREETRLRRSAANVAEGTEDAQVSAAGSEADLRETQAQEARETLGAKVRLANVDTEASALALDTARQTQGATVRGEYAKAGTLEAQQQITEAHARVADEAAQLGVDLSRGQIAALAADEEFTREQTRGAALVRKFMAETNPIRKETLRQELVGHKLGNRLKMIEVKLANMSYEEATTPEARKMRLEAVQLGFEKLRLETNHMALENRIKHYSAEMAKMQTRWAVEDRHHQLSRRPTEDRLLELQVARQAIDNEAASYQTEMVEWRASMGQQFADAELEIMRADAEYKTKAALAAGATSGPTSTELGRIHASNQRNLEDAYNKAAMWEGDGFEAFIETQSGRKELRQFMDVMKIDDPDEGKIAFRKMRIEQYADEKKAWDFARNRYIDLMDQGFMPHVAFTIVMSEVRTMREASLEVLPGKPEEDGAPPWEDEVPQYEQPY